MNVVERFKALAAEERFKGWPLVSEYVLGAKIPFFGQVLEYNLQTPTGVQSYYSLLRYFGWAVVFGITRDLNVITLVQWKPGLNKASWELPPGGIGKIAPEATQEEILAKTQQAYLKETGYGGGDWSRLGYVLIETGKYRGAGPGDHGLPAHLFMAKGLVKQVQARQPNPEEIMENLEVPLEQFREVIESGLFVEASALPCALLALRRIENMFALY